MVFINPNLTQQNQFDLTKKGSIEKEYPYFLCNFKIARPHIDMGSPPYNEGCIVLKKVYSFYLNPDICLLLLFNPIIGLQ